MGHRRGALRRGVSSEFILLISITIFLIGLERVQTLEFAPGRRPVSDSMVKAMSLFRPSSLSDLPRALPTASDEGSSRSFILPELAPVVEVELSRRELLSGRLSYISYRVLSASHVPCPPRSGRSYYTPNCRSASGPVRPYRRGCSRMARCSRG